MQLDEILTPGPQGLWVWDPVLKFTALLYFAQALEVGTYEECAELVRSARDFGARDYEIDAVIAAHLKGLKPAEDQEDGQLSSRRIQSIKKDK